MTRNRYILMTESDHLGSKGQRFPDLTSFPLGTFKYTEEPRRHALTQSDLDRFDKLVHDYYGTSDYDDLLLWLNRVDDIHKLKVTDEIIVPAKRDMERFYVRNFT